MWKLLIIYGLFVCQIIGGIGNFFINYFLCILNYNCIKLFSIFIANDFQFVENPQFKLQNSRS